MRYPASEKLEIIRIVEKSHLPVRQTLSKLGIPRATFYRWYDLFRLGGIDALADHRPLPGHVWNRVTLPLHTPQIQLENRTALFSNFWHWTA